MTHDTAARQPRRRGLWIARELPFPLDSGDRIYSGHLMRAVAEAGVDLTVTGFASEPVAAPPVEWPVFWRRVPGTRRCPRIV